MSGRRRPTDVKLKSVWDSIAVLEAFQEHGVKPNHAYKLWGHLIRNPSGTWHDLQDMPKVAKQLLDKDFVKFTTKVLTCQTSTDGDTTKLLVQLQDGQQVEAVIMTYDTRVAKNTAEDQNNGGSGHNTSTIPVVDLTHAPEGHDDHNNNTNSSNIGYQATDTDDDSDDFHSCNGSYDEDHDHHDNSLAGVAHGNAPGVTEQLAGSAPSHDTDGYEQYSVSSETISRSSHSLGPRRKGPKKEMLGNKRATLCVSSQVGCQQGCTFCATGTMGLLGNLTAGEIIEQLVHANAVSKIRNIVFMGMGEPLANYEPVRAAVQMMTNNKLFGLRRSHVTISTVGVIPRIKQLATDMPGVSLALSLHASNQELRKTIVPSARAYPLDRLMQAVQQYEVDSKQRVFMEYVMLSGVNDGPEQAHELGALLQRHNATLNLIPWNPVLAAASEKEGGLAAPMRFTAPRLDDVFAFQAIIRDQYGIPTTVRQEKGQDISGACGQLVISEQQRKQQLESASAAATANKQDRCGGTSCSGASTPQASSATMGGVKDIEELGAR